MGGDAPVKRHAAFGNNVRCTGEYPMIPCCIEGGALSFKDARSYGDVCVSQDAAGAPCVFWVGVCCSVDDASESVFQNGGCTGRGASVCRAGLEGNINRGSVGEVGIF